MQGIGCFGCNICNISAQLPGRTACAQSEKFKFIKVTFFKTLEMQTVSNCEEAKLQFIKRHCGGDVSVVSLDPCVRRVTGSNPTLAAM